MIAPVDIDQQLTLIPKLPLPRARFLCQSTTPCTVYANTSSGRLSSLQALRSVQCDGRGGFAVTVYEFGTRSCHRPHGNPNICAKMFVKRSDIETAYDEDTLPTELQTSELGQIMPVLGLPEITRAGCCGFDFAKTALMDLGGCTRL